jgi:hypothetical protein
MAPSPDLGLILDLIGFYALGAERLSAAWDGQT